VLLCITTLGAYWAGVSKLNNFYKTDYYQSDSLAVFVHQPNYLRTFSWPEHPDSEITFKTNNLGFRNQEDINVSKSPNEVRILITGDSHTDGVVNNNESMAAVLAKKLNSEVEVGDSDSTFTVINGGHGFYSFKNYFGLVKKYRYLGLKHFIIIVFTGNDFRETLLYEKEAKSFPFVMKNISYRIKRKLRLDWGHDIPLNQGIDQEYYFSEYPEDEAAALDIAEDYMLKIEEFCDSNNINLTVALLPARTDIDSTFSKRVNTELGLGEKVTKKNKDIVRQFKTWMKHKNIKVLDLEKPLSKANNKIYWDKDLHINNNAHQIIGDFLYNQLFLKAE
jgi:hypothetical protein